MVHVRSIIAVVVVSFLLATKQSEQLNMNHQETQAPGTTVVSCVQKNWNRHQKEAESLFLTLRQFRSQKPYTKYERV